jgi:sigma-B regulation protein RsbU (phosphoserine phosphatase)
MRTQAAVNTSVSPDSDDSPSFGTDTIACIIPQVHADLGQHIEDLQEKISQLSFELNLLRRRDAHVNGMMSKLDEEQRLAARLQQDFLPKRLPQLGQVHFQTLFRPASYVSGDLYDVMRLDESHVGFYVADAVGHGMPAALLTMFMKNALVTKDIANGAYRVLDPSETMSRLNNSLCEQNLSNATFATAVYGTLNTDTLMLSVARGGHPQPLLLRDGKMSELDAEGALLGIFPDETFSTCHVQLQRGDRVLVYTDGIEVAFTETDAADDDRWRAELVKLADQPISAIIDGFTKQLDGFGGSILPKDDLTIVGMEIR